LADHLSVYLRNALLLMLLVPSVFATEYSLPKENERLIGQNINHIVASGDYFQLLAERYNVGFLALLAANPDVDPFLPQVNSSIIVPKQMLLPFGKRKGIVINLPELRLYYFPEHGNSVHVFPVGIGRQGLQTPKTTSYISEKVANPTWRPPKALRERYLKEKGIVLAKEVPPGPNNPFGKYSLRLGTSEYLIHGTNQRFGIGMRSSSGCIRMYDDDIKWLFDNVPVDTQVKIINQPVKISYENSQQRLAELHQPLSEQGEGISSLIDNPRLKILAASDGSIAKKLNEEANNPSGLVRFYQKVP